MYIMYFIIYSLKKLLAGTGSAARFSRPKVVDKNLCKKYGLINRT